MTSTSGTEARSASCWRPEEDAVRCGLCPHRCRIARGKAGICGVRENRAGALVAATYGKAASVAIDPIEKKPLFHFHPGASILSIGSVGCNFRCEFCQNWQLVLRRAPLADVRIPDLVAAARKGGSVGIAYTYNEPLIQFEFVLDCSKAFRAAGMKNVLVTNGYVLPEPLAELLPFVDAMNVDLKSMDPAFYREVCGGELAPVLETIRTAAKATHVEVTNLLYTGRNDSDEAVRRVIDFVADTDPEIPLHFSRYFPQHRATAPPTPPARIESAWRAARKRLPYVYVGNISMPGGEDTVCPGCGKTAVRRTGYRTEAVGLSGARCASCGAGLRFVI
ncbi:MAG: AmmeMemoRadiSam system radical SAM enzyme [Deltaproteobacteria bacterium]|nr:MAG: AmmeMemoRadiSam system radical SAM enzyme [Deltaproteobacteria bacterium]